MNEQMVGTGEILRQHGIDRLQVYRLIKTGDWPEPVVELARGRVWLKADVDERVRLLRKAGRLVKDGRQGHEGEWQVVPWRYIDGDNYARRAKLRPWSVTAIEAQV